MPSKASKARPAAAKKSHRGTRPATKPATSPALMQQAMIRRLPIRMTGKAELLLPAVPGFVDHYVRGFSAAWEALGRPFGPAEIDYFRQTLSQMLKEAFNRSPYSSVWVVYETDPHPKETISWQMGIRHSTIEDEYAGWIATRTPPLFGHHPDAKVMDLARSLGTRRDIAVLDVGAGTGRNTIPLAKEGFRADAVELSPPLAEILRQDVKKQNLPIHVYEGDILDPSLPVPQNHYTMLLLAEVVSHFRQTRQLRALFETANRLLVPGGLLLFSAFLAAPGYEPDEVARTMSQVMWCSMFTRHELQDAVARLPFDSVSDESTRKYEQTHLPADQWPPTGWYEDWTAGRDVFDLPASETPLEMRWMTYRKRPTQ
ncbi:MAG TPA: methyltransferase domain-containing protein [Polyangiaceae bacterium]|nr:methyltransferase domain-containing protein [Polyangiaceae bacterium]